MTQSPGIILTIIAFLCVIGPLVFVHEMGHYLGGRLFDIKADAFSIGFGTEVAGWTDKRGTRWKVGWLPLGGYVKFAGDMNPASQPDAAWLSLPAEERRRTFQAKPVWQRAIVVAAGPAINFVAAILILSAFALAYGDADGPAAIGSVQPASAALRAGVQAGDRVITLGGRPVTRFAEMTTIVQPLAGKPLDVVVDRGGATLKLHAIVGSQHVTDAAGKPVSFGLLGVRPPGATPVRALAAGVRRTGSIVVLMAQMLGEVVDGRRSVKELGGPLSIAKVSGEQMALGADAFAFLVALISINLGFINLLPVPMLDGGHLLFYAIEAIRRRPVGPAVQEWAFRGGLAAVLTLMLVVTFNDLGNVGVWHRLAGLIG